jgi:hypothetical protein
MKLRNIIFTILISFLFFGCSYKYQEREIKISQIELPIISASLLHTLQTNNNKILLNSKLTSFYKEWKGVKYKFGGNSKSGIDCSAFIQKAYKHKLNITIPRTTISQAKLGKNIHKSQLEIGDLVFFKTGKNSRHVGIYMEDGKFMHASSSKGVIISKLDNIYFNKHYWKSKRIIY